MKLNSPIKQAKLLLLFISLCASTGAYAQTQRVTGTVFSGLDDTPLIGATLLERGTTNGTITDIDGNFSIEVSGPESVLEVSFLGYKTIEVAANNSPLTITLLEDANTLSEVTVVGYGTQKKSDIVNAVATAKIDQALLTPTSDVNEMLRGRIAGLQVDVGGGTLRPGGTSDIIFRGQGSVEGNVSAIYVVDGIIRDGGIEDIDPDDIESIEFLKDASAQAIYGSRGANGVVLITTKRGSEDGGITVSYHGYLTSKSLERNFDVYNGQEFAQLKREAVRSTFANDSFPNDEDIFSEIELENIANDNFVDWEDELVERGLVNSQAISINGGNDMTKVFGSFNYFKESGIIPTSTYTRKTLRLNVDQKINESFGVNFDLNLLNDDTERAANVNVITNSPLGRAYDEDGEIVQFPSGEELSAVSPLWNLREQNNETEGNDYVVNITPYWQITDNILYQLKTNFTRRNDQGGQYQSSLSSAGDDVGGIARISSTQNESYLVENILTYNREVTPTNNFNLTLVQSIQEYQFTRTFTEGQGFTNESLGFNGITNAIGNVSVERDQNKQRLASFMARARYSIANKYYFTATARGDGASVNSADNKWSFNPAASFAWKLHNESFMENVTAVQDMKLRLSYGSLVNDLGRAYTSLFTASGENYIFDGQSASGYSPSVILPNPNLQFERIRTLNIGLDFSAFKRKLEGNINFYDSRTHDLLLRRGVPSTTGYQFTYFNAGVLQNKGIELSLTANLVRSDDFRWSVSTNWSNNSNKLLELYDDGDGEPVLRDDNFNYYVGQPVGVIYQYEFDGIWQEGDDFENAPQANPESALVQENLRPGDIRIKDTNGVDDMGNETGMPDGRITQEDRVFIDPNPNWFGSFSTTIQYKGFDIFADFYAVQGATKVNPFLSDFNNGGTISGKLNGVKVDYYTPESPSTDFPRANFDATPLYLNSLAVRDASYLRLRTISLGYTLPDAITSNLNFEQLRIYVTGTNLFTSTDYIGYSPEVNIRSTFSNADTGYPDATAFTFGLRAKF